MLRYHALAVPALEIVVLHYRAEVVLKRLAELVQLVHYDVVLQIRVQDLLVELIDPLHLFYIAHILGRRLPLVELVKREMPPHIANPHGVKSLKKYSVVSDYKIILLQQIIHHNTTVQTHIIKHFLNCYKFYYVVLQLHCSQPNALRKLLLRKQHQELLCTKLRRYVRKHFIHRYNNLVVFASLIFEDKF